MKYETRVVIFVVVLCILLLLILTREHWFQFKEGARTLPRPTRHAFTEVNNVVNVARPSAGQPSMNQWTDQLISQYFDENNVPYTNTIALYKKYCVSQGFTTDENKIRLKDLCFYTINYVIPSLPSVVNPNPVVILPPIEFNSTNFNAYSYNANGLANLQTNYWDNNAGPSFNGNFPGFGGFNNFNNNSTDSSGGSEGSSGTSGSSGSSGTSGSSGSGNSCGSCPTSCLSSLSNSMNDSPGSSGSGGLSGLGSYDASLSQQYGVPYISPEAIYNLAIQSISPYSYIGRGGYMITDASNLFFNPDIRNSLLNNNIIGLFSMYFDVSNNANDIDPCGNILPKNYTPSPQAVSVFDFFTANYLPIDDEHKNKLRDLVFYIMEEIIPGLPTTPTHPNSYVEWKPIRWLSHSSM